MIENTIIIKKSDNFSGSYSSSGELILHGFFNGYLKIDTLFIKENGVFFCFFSAKKIIVEGELCADIEVGNIKLMSTGIINGDLIYRDLIIESGGILKSSNIYNTSSLIQQKQCVDNA